MKNMYLTGKITVVLLLILSSYSCKKESLFCPMEKQISGQWKFDKVTFHKNLSFTTNNITADFAGDLLQLKDDKSIVYTKGGTTSRYGGNWELRTAYNAADEQNSVSYTLDINVDQGESFLGTNVSVTKHKLIFYEVKNNGTYTYHFIR